MKYQDTPPHATPVVGFRSRKAAQLSAFFAVKSAGQIEKLKLIKLIYMAERQFLADNHHSMLLDEFYSLPHGPICSSALNGINGVIHPDIWDDYVARNGNVVVAVKKFDRDDLDEVSDAEIDTLEATWSQFGTMSASQIRNYSHKHCPEYTEVESGRIPISYKEVLEAFGDKDAALVEQHVADLRRAESVLLG